MTPRPPQEMSIEPKASKLLEDRYYKSTMQALRQNPMVLPLTPLPSTSPLTGPTQPTAQELNLEEINLGQRSLAIVCNHLRCKRKRARPLFPTPKHLYRQHPFPVRPSLSLYISPGGPRRSSA